MELVPSRHAGAQDVSVGILLFSSRFCVETRGTRTGAPPVRRPRCSSINRRQGSQQTHPCSPRRPLFLLLRGTTVGRVNDGFDDRQEIGVRLLSLLLPASMLSYKLPTNLWLAAHELKDGFGDRGKPEDGIGLEREGFLALSLF